MAITRVANNQTNRIFFNFFSIFTPHIWEIMIICIYPFFLLVTNYFEKLERMGTLEAIIADTLMPATIISYVTLIFVLKKKRYE
jgi:hypothetical protein